MRLRPSSVWVILVLACGGAGRSAALPPLDGAGVARLARYDVLGFATPAPGGAEVSRAVGVFDATPDEVFRTVTDYARLAEFAPRVSGSTVVEHQREDRTLVLLTAHLPWPISDARVVAQFETERLPGEVYRIRFWQVRGTMRRYQGSIVIEPWPADGHAARRSSVTYEQLADPDTYAPRRLVNARLRDAATHYVHALRQRVNDLHRLGRLHPQQAPDPDLPSTLAGERGARVIENVAARH